MIHDRRLHRPGHPHHIPDAWPALLSLDQLCAYVGLAAVTLKRVYPHAPLALGANVLRYSRAQADAWVAGLSPRLPKKLGEAQGVEEPPAAGPLLVDDDPVAASLDAVRRRAEGGSQPCRKAKAAG